MHKKEDFKLLLDICDGYRDINRRNNDIKRLGNSLERKMGIFGCIISILWIILIWLSPSSISWFFLGWFMSLTFYSILRYKNGF